MSLRLGVFVLMFSLHYLCVSVVNRIAFAFSATSSRPSADFAALASEHVRAIVDRQNDGNFRNHADARTEALARDLRPLLAGVAC